MNTIILIIGLAIIINNIYDMHDDIKRIMWDVKDIQKHLEVYKEK